MKRTKGYLQHVLEMYVGYNNIIVEMVIHFLEITLCKDIIILRGKKKKNVCLPKDCRITCCNDVTLKLRKLGI